MKRVDKDAKSQDFAEQARGNALPERLILPWCFEYVFIHLNFHSSDSNSLKGNQTHN